MKRILTLIAAIACTAAITHAQLSPAEKATAAAEAWLKLVDEGAYPDAYAKSSEKWHERMKEDSFSRLMKGHRGPRGDFQSRSLVSAEKMKGENLGEGKKYEIMTVRFSTEWSKAKGIEIVNVVEDEDKEWRAFGYTIQGSSGRSVEEEAAKTGGKPDKDKKRREDQKKD